MLQNDVGDVQTALAVLIVMGENRKFLPIEEALIVSKDFMLNIFRKFSI